MKKNYVKFLGMIVTSAIFMYGVMYLNTYEWDHIFFSEMRLYGRNDSSSFYSDFN